MNEVEPCKETNGSIDTVESGQNHFEKALRKTCCRPLAQDLYTDNVIPIL